MSLATKIHSAFWSDEEVAELDASLKLALIWVLTNDGTSNLGFVKVSRKRFEFDTGLPLTSLEGALKALGRTFPSRHDEKGLRVLALSYIHYQFAHVVNKPNDKVHIHLVRLLQSSEGWVQECILGRYKGLARSFYTEKGLTSSSQAPCKGPDQTRPEETRPAQTGSDQTLLVEGVGGGRNSEPPWPEVPSDEDVFEFSETWTGELATGAPKIPRSYVNGWLARMNGRREWPLDWKRKLIADWRKDFRAYGEGNGQKTGVAHPLDAKRRLDGLKEAIATHPGNPDGSGYMGSCTEEEEKTLTKMRHEKARLEKELIQ